MEQVLVALDEKITDLNSLNERFQKLQRKQEDILVELMKKNRAIAEKIKEEGYSFTHPKLDWRSRKGPILGYVREENSLYVFDLEKGILKINPRTNDVENSSFRTIVREGLFEDASAGIEYVTVMIDVYLKEMQESVDRVATQISKYE